MTNDELHKLTTAAATGDLPALQAVALLCAEVRRLNAELGDARENLRRIADLLATRRLDGGSGGQAVKGLVQGGIASR